MNFKNPFERQLFEAAERVCGSEAKVEHNKVLQIDVATAPEVASFVGPPGKEIDVITAGFRQNPFVKILISSKDFSNSKAEPADVQEWAAVVRTMNRYSSGTRHLGLIVSPAGFTSGCEPWASSYNLGLIPPLKGKRLAFSAETTVEMFARVLTAFSKRLHFPHDVLFDPPQFYEFVYELTEAFEGRDKAVRESRGRYKHLGTGWVGSFGELVLTFKGKALEQIEPTDAGIFIRFSDCLVFQLREREILFGPDEGTASGNPIEIRCDKNLDGDSCSFDFIKKLVVGQRVTSAGDWGDRFEFGLTDELMLAIEPQRLQILRTRNTPEDNLL